MAGQEHLKCWLGDLLDGIENSGNHEACIGLLKSCGSNCAKRNVIAGMSGLKEKISNLDNMDEIAEAIRQHTGAECIPEVDGFTVSYNRGGSCDCSLVENGYVASPVFCNCTLGFHKTVWSMVFQRPVTVELLESFLRGGNCCALKITFEG